MYCWSRLILCKRTAFWRVSRLRLRDQQAQYWSLCTRSYVPWRIGASNSMFSEQMSISLLRRSSSRYSWALEVIYFIGTTRPSYFFRMLRHENPKIPVFIWGHGIGAVFAIRVAVEHENHTDGLILESPFINPSETAIGWHKTIGGLKSWKSMNLNYLSSISQLSCSRLENSCHRAFLLYVRYSFSIDNLHKIISRAENPEQTSRRSFVLP